MLALAESYRDPADWSSGSPKGGRARGILWEDRQQRGLHHRRQGPLLHIQHKLNHIPVGVWFSLCCICGPILWKLKCRFRVGHVLTNRSQPVPAITLQWHHNERGGVSNQRCIDCLFNRLFRCRSKKASKLRVTDLCYGNPPVTGGFISQRISEEENVSFWWRHYEHLLGQIQMHR